MNSSVAEPAEHSEVLYQRGSAVGLGPAVFPDAPAIYSEEVLDQAGVYASTGHASDAHLVKISSWSLTFDSAHLEAEFDEEYHGHWRWFDRWWTLLVFGGALAMLTRVPSLWTLDALLIVLVGPVSRVCLAVLPLVCIRTGLSYGRGRALAVVPARLTRVALMAVIFMQGGLGSLDLQCTQLQLVCNDMWMTCALVICLASATPFKHHLLLTVPQLVTALTSILHSGGLCDALQGATNGCPLALHAAVTTPAPVLAMTTASTAATSPSQSAMAVAAAAAATATSSSAAAAVETQTTALCTQLLDRFAGMSRALRYALGLLTGEDRVLEPAMGPSDECRAVLTFLHTAFGMMLPSCLMYAHEARARRLFLFNRGLTPADSGVLNIGQLLLLTGMVSMYSWAIAIAVL